MPNIVARARSGEGYKESDWVERDNFDTKDQALAYMRMNVHRFGRTPYRVIEQNGRYTVEFVPEWKLLGSSRTRSYREVAEGFAGRERNRQKGD